MFIRDVLYSVGPGLTRPSIIIQRSLVYCGYKELELTEIGEKPQSVGI